MSEIVLDILFINYCKRSLHHLRFKRLGGLPVIEREGRLLIIGFKWEESRLWNLL